MAPAPPGNDHRFDRSGPHLGLARPDRVLGVGRGPDRDLQRLQRGDDGLNRGPSLQSKTVGVRGLEPMHTAEAGEATFGGKTQS